MFPEHLCTFPLHTCNMISHHYTMVLGTGPSSAWSMTVYTARSAVPHLHLRFLESPHQRARCPLPNIQMRKINFGSATAIIDPRNKLSL